MTRHDLDYVTWSMFDWLDDGINTRLYVWPSNRSTNQTTDDMIASSVVAITQQNDPRLKWNEMYNWGVWNGNESRVIIDPIILFVSQAIAKLSSCYQSLNDRQNRQMIIEEITGSKIVALWCRVTCDNQWEFRNAPTNQNIERWTRCVQSPYHHLVFTLMYPLCVIVYTYYSRSRLIVCYQSSLADQFILMFVCH